jgi:hypothetical protein
MPWVTVDKVTVAEGPNGVAVVVVADGLMPLRDLRQKEIRWSQNLKMKSIRHPNRLQQRS